MKEITKLNKEWHLRHPMPENPTLEERIAWHIDHARHCGCREMPANIREIIRQRKINIFKQ